MLVGGNDGNDGTDGNDGGGVGIIAQKEKDC